jgi:hypothetical protein
MVNLDPKLVAKDLERLFAKEFSGDYDVLSAIRSSPESHIIETHLSRGGKTAHEFAQYKRGDNGKVVLPESIVYGSGFPRGFCVVLKKTTDYPLKGVNGFVPKIDWTYLKPSERGKGLSTRYFLVLQKYCKQMGIDGFAIDATDDGVAYWANPKFGMMLAPKSASKLAESYEEYRQIKGFPYKDITNNPREYTKDFLAFRAALQKVKGGKTMYYKAL